MPLVTFTVSPWLVSNSLSRCAVSRSLLTKTRSRRFARVSLAPWLRRLDNLVALPLMETLPGGAFWSDGQAIA
jgi:hypothetical protein